MAVNTRLFKAHNLSLNGVAIGGLSAIGFDTSYRNISVSELTGEIGVTDVDRSQMRIGFTIVTTDVTKALALLNALPGAVATEWYGERSGTDAGVNTARKWTVPTTDGEFVIDSMSIDLPLVGDATLTIGGAIRFGTSASAMSDILEFIDNAAFPTLVKATRLRHPHNMSFATEAGTPVVQAIANIESVRLSLSARLVEDGTEDDFGHVAVDRIGWNALQTSVTFKDEQKVTGAYNVAANLFDLSKGNLTVDFAKAGTVIPAPPEVMTLTVKNLLWTGGSENHSQEYTTLTIDGQSGWVSRQTTTDTFYDLNATPLFSFA